MTNAMQQAALQQHRRVRSLGSNHTLANERDEDLILFHEMQSIERASSFSSVTQTLERDASAVSDFRNKAGQEDIFSSSEWDKNDYDWLLTPPATALIPNIDHEAVGNGYSLSGVASTKSSLNATSKLGISRAEPPSRAEPVARIVRRTLGVQQPATNTGSKFSTTDSFLQKSLTSSTKAILRPSSPRSNGRPSTLISQPAARPSTPTRTAAASRVSTSSSSSTSVRPLTPTRRSAMVSSVRTASSSGPSLAHSANTSASVTSTRTTSNSVSMVSTRPGGSSSRASTPVKRSATPTRTANPPPSTIVRSSSASKTSSLPQPKSAASSRPSSPATSRVRQPATQPAVPPGFSEEPPPNLRTSMPNRPHSNSRGSLASRACGTRPAQSEATNDGARSLRLSGSPLTTRGRISSDPINSGKSLGKGKSHDTLQTALSNGLQSKMVDRAASTKKPLGLTETPSVAICSQLKKPVKSSPIRDSKLTTPSVRESTGFGRNLSKKSLDMALRHMDIRKDSPSGFKSFMSNVPASSLYSVRSGNGRGLSSSSVAESPMATSSYASSEHSMSIAIDREESEVGGDEILTERGKASPISQLDSYNERKVNSWLASPNYADGNNADILQVFEQGLEKMSSMESPLINHHDSKIECDDFILEPS